MQENDSFVAEVWLFEFSSETRFVRITGYETGSNFFYGHLQVFLLL